MRHVLQPKGSWYCGHCSVAMVTDTELNTVIGGMGQTRSDGGSTADMIANYSASLGFNVYCQHPIDNRKPVDLRGRGVLFVTGTNGLSHAVAYEDGTVYDPYGQVYNGIAAMKK